MHQKQSIIRLLSIICHALAVLTALAVFAPLAQQAQQTDPAAYSIVQNGPHSRVWQRVNAQTNLDGSVQSRTSSYTELATGLNRLVNGQWVESSETIQITADGAAATNGQHQVYFSANINTPSRIHLVTPDGQDMESGIAGLAYYDSSTSYSVVIGELQDSTGQLLPSLNQALYTNAFTGLQADVRYTYTKAGLEQDVILRAQLPPPSQWNLNPATTRLQVWTEFTETPAPQIDSYTNDQTGEVVDDYLSFGAMQIGPGKAFSLADGSGLTPVFKHWQTVPNEGVSYLIEEVPLNAIAAQLQGLPPPTGSNSTNAVGHQASLLRQISEHAARLAGKTTGKAATQMRVAKTSLPARGFVLDYAILSSASNFTFQADTTYYVSGAVNLTGTNIIEGGTVIKFTNTSSATITITNLVCQTAPYRPAVFTSKDDRSVGAVIGTNAPVPGIASYLVYNIKIRTTPAPLEYLRFAYAGLALTQNVYVPLARAPAEVWHSQFLNCGTAIYDNAGSNSALSQVLHNVLFSQCGCGVTNYLTFGDESFSVTGENITADQMGVFSTTDALLTNSILTAVTNLTGASLSYCVTNASSAGFYQTVGAGNYYLAGNTYRNAGTTNINPAVLADLRQKTTYPPEASIYTIDVSGTHDLAPYAIRDNGTGVDYGYHYDPIDNALGGITFSAGDLNIRPGTVVVPYSTASASTNFGLRLGSSARLLCEGTANALCRIVNYNTVQEQSGSSWITPFNGLILPNTSSAPPSTNNCRFTDFSVMAQDTAFFYNAATSTNTSPINLQDCQFHGGLLYSAYATINLTNCLLERVALTNSSGDGLAPFIRNCLFFRGSLNLTFSAYTGLIQDNFFDGTVINDHGNSSYASYYNGYLINSNHLTLTNGNDVFLTNSPAYQPGQLGSYYLPTGCPLIDKGSDTNAQDFGLYLYCTTADQLAETNSPVDIGYHYVALNPIGVPSEFSEIGVLPDLLYYKMTEYVPITVPTGLPTYTNYSVNLTDSSSYAGGDGATATVAATTGVPIVWRPNQTGLYTGTIHYNGSSTTLDTGNNTRFNFTTNLFTLNVWVQPEIFHSGVNWVLVGNGSYQTNGWYAFLNSIGQAGLEADYLGGTADVVTTSGVSLPKTWSMLTFVRNGINTVLIYKDGVAVSTSGSFTNPATCSANLWIGNYHGVNDVLDGDIGVVRIYSNVISPTQFLSFTPMEQMA